MGTARRRARDADGWHLDDLRRDGAAHLRPTVWTAGAQRVQRVKRKARTGRADWALLYCEWFLSPAAKALLCAVCGR